MVMWRWTIYSFRVYLLGRGGKEMGIGEWA